MNDQQREEVYNALIDLRKRVSLLESDASKNKKQSLLEQKTSTNDTIIKKTTEMLRQHTHKIILLKERIGLLEMLTRNLKR